MVRNKFFLLPAAAALIFISACSGGKEISLITIDPELNHALIDNPPQQLDAKSSLQSLEKTGDIVTMAFYGDTSALIKNHHHELLRVLTTMENKKKIHCSMFSFIGRGGRSIYGRNFDNIDTGLFAGYFFPLEGYFSIAFSSLFEFGFTKETPLDLSNPFHRAKFINAPALTIEGINEKGITVSLASLDMSRYEPDRNKEPKFLLHLVREILDRAGSLEEAVSIGTRYNVFDNGRNIISHHIFIGSPDGHSAVLEYSEGKIQVVENSSSWQVVTNSPLFKIPEAKRRGACIRYNKTSRALEKWEGDFTWQDGMRLLKRIKQKNRIYNSPLTGRMVVSTQWSAVFDMKAREIFICLRGDYGKAYRLHVPFSKSAGIL